MSRKRNNKTMPAPAEETVPETSAETVRINLEEAREKLSESIDRLDSMLAYCDRITGGGDPP